MAKKEKDIARSPKFDPSIPRVAVEIQGEQFELAFDFRALAAAKAKLRALGVEVNIMHAIDFRSLDVDSLPALFYAAAQRYHPDLDWERALELVNIRTFAGVFSALAEAYAAAVRLPDDPPQAVVPETPAAS